MRRLRPILVLCAALLSGAATAEEHVSPEGLLVGAKVGAGFGQPLGPFGATFLPELEVGFAPGPSLLFFLAGQYAAPVATGTVPSDPRLPGSGEVAYRVVQNQAILTLGLSYRPDLGAGLLRPYASLGARLYLMRSDVSGEVDGEPFGPDAESATGFGAYGALGVERVFGPGTVVGELQVGWVPLDLFVLRETSAGSLNAVLGYRLWF